MNTSEPKTGGGRNLVKRLGAYSAAAAATVATQGTANAAEVVWDLTTDVTAGNTPGLLFNVITGATAVPIAATGNADEGSFRLASWAAAPYIAGPANSAAAGFVGPGGFDAVDVYPSLLLAGDTVGPLKNFAVNNEYLSYGGYGYLSLNFAAGSKGFVGLQFDIGGELHYGWAEVTHLGSGLGTTLHAFGYNDTPGQASALVPEPGSALLFALGTAGLGMRRRRKTS